MKVAPFLEILYFLTLGTQSNARSPRPELETMKE